MHAWSWTYREWKKSTSVWVKLYISCILNNHQVIENYEYVIFPPYLESSSNRKELLTALFESSVINTLILDMTYMENIDMIKSDLFSLHFFYMKSSYGFLDYIVKAFSKNLHQGTRYVCHTYHPNTWCLSDIAAVYWEPVIREVIKNCELYGKVNLVGWNEFSLTHWAQVMTYFIQRFLWFLMYNLIMDRKYQFDNICWLINRTSTEQMVSSQN